MKRTLLLLSLISFTLVFPLRPGVGSRVGVSYGQKMPDFWVHDTFMGTTATDRHFIDIDAGNFERHRMRTETLDVNNGSSQPAESSETMKFSVDYRYLFDNKWYIGTSPSISLEHTVRGSKKARRELYNANINILDGVSVGRLFATSAWHGKFELFAKNSVGLRGCAQHQFVRVGAWKYYLDTYGRVSWKPRVNKQAAQIVTEFFAGGRVAYKQLSMGAGYTLGVAVAHQEDKPTPTRSIFDNNQQEPLYMPSAIPFHVLSADVSVRWKGLAATLFAHGLVVFAKRGLGSGVGGKLSWTF